MLIDTHCHLTVPELLSQADAVMQRAAEAGVERVITVATTPADARAALELMKAQPAVYLAAGIHPHEAGKCSEDDFAALSDLHRGNWDLGDLRGRLVAVGETGLDFHYDFAPPEQQERVFCAQLELAAEVGRPVVIHAREAENRVCDILADYPALAGRVVFHCFSADADAARRILDLDCWLSFTGMVTFRNADAVRAVAQFVPLDRIMVETDAPYLSPEPLRNVRLCEPAFVLHTARRLADTRSEALESFAAATTANAERFFNLSQEAI